MITAHEALRQLHEVSKLIDFKDCAESPELWHKINAAQQVAEEVLKRPEQSEIWCVQKLRDAAADPMLHDHAEVSKNLLIGAANIIEAASARIAKLKAEASPVASQKAVAAVPDWKDQLYAAMDAQFALRESAKRDEDGQRVGMVIDDTQVGVEFAMSWLEKHIIAAPQPAAAPSGDAIKVESIDCEKFRKLADAYHCCREQDQVEPTYDALFQFVDKEIERQVRAAITATKE